MTTIAAPAAPVLIRWHYLWLVAATFAVMAAAIASGNPWYLNFVHVIFGVMWTGIDLFMGFVVGPVLRRLDVPVRRAVLLRLVPRTLFLMPTLAIVTGTTGWFLASLRGFNELPWPQYGWVAAALVLVVLMTVQGIGYLLPTNLRVCFELQKPNPDNAKLARLTRSYFFVTALQGTMQVLIIVIMARFVTGI
jgi:uncharacterized membrane protein